MTEWHKSYVIDGFAVIANAIKKDFVIKANSLADFCMNQKKTTNTGMSISQYFKLKPQRFNLPGHINTDDLGMYIVGIPENHADVVSLLSCRALWNIAAKALNKPIEDVEFSYMNFTRKPAYFGPSISFHRDFINKYLCTNNSEDMVRVIIPLCDSNHITGATSFIPSSHQIDDAMALTDKIDQLECRKNAITPYTKIGDALVFHSKVIHGGGTNTSSQDRINMILQFVVANARHRHHTNGEPFNGCTYAKINNRNIQQNIEPGNADFY